MLARPWQTPLLLFWILFIAIFKSRITGSGRSHPLTFNNYTPLPWPHTSSPSFLCDYQLNEMKTRLNCWNEAAQVVIETIRLSSSLCLVMNAGAPSAPCTPFSGPNEPRRLRQIINFSSSLSSLVSLGSELSAYRFHSSGKLLGMKLWWASCCSLFSPYKGMKMESKNKQNRFLSLSVFFPQFLPPPSSLSLSWPLPGVYCINQALAKRRANEIRSAL